MSFYITYLVKGYNLPEPLTRNLTINIKAILNDYNLPGGEIGLIIVSDYYIKKLNKKYRGKDSPTDVLSFSFLEPEHEDMSDEEDFAIGDIIISLDRAREQASEQGHSLEQEIVLLTIHGLLHLLGYDHERKEDRELMQSQEEKIKKLFVL